MYFGKLVLVKCETFFVLLLYFIPPPPLPSYTHIPHLTSSFQTVSMQCDTVLIHRLKCVPELVKVGREREKGERRGEREGREEETRREGREKEERKRVEKRK